MERRRPPSAPPERAARKSQSAAATSSSAPIPVRERLESRHLLLLTVPANATGELSLAASKPQSKRERRPLLELSRGVFLPGTSRAPPSFLQEVSIRPWIWMAVLLGVWRMLIDYWIAPRVLGRELEIHPLLAIFTLMAGGAIGGSVGVYLSLPVVAALRVVWRRIASPAPHSAGAADQLPIPKGTSR